MGESRIMLLTIDYYTKRNNCTLDVCVWRFTWLQERKKLHGPHLSRVFRANTLPRAHTHIGVFVVPSSEVTAWVGWLINQKTRGKNANLMHEHD